MTVGRVVDLLLWVAGVVIAVVGIATDDLALTAFGLAVIANARAGVLEDDTR